MIGRGGWGWGFWGGQIDRQTDRDKDSERQTETEMEREGETGTEGERDGEKESWGGGGGREGGRYKEGEAGEGQQRGRHLRIYVCIGGLGLACGPHEPGGALPQHSPP